MRQAPNRERSFESPTANPQEIASIEARNTKYTLPPPIPDEADFDRLDQIARIRNDIHTPELSSDLLQEIKGPDKLQKPPEMQVSEELFAFMKDNKHDSFEALAQEQGISLNPDGTASGWRNKRKLKGILRSNEHVKKRYDALIQQYDARRVAKETETNPMNISPPPRTFMQKLAQSRVGKFLLGAGLAGGVSVGAASHVEQAQQSEHRANIAAAQKNYQPADTGKINPIAGIESFSGNTSVDIDPNTHQPTPHQRMDGIEIRIKNLPKLKVGEKFPLGIFGGNTTVTIGKELTSTLTQLINNGEGFIIKQSNTDKREKTVYQLQDGKIVGISTGNNFDSNIANMRQKIEMERFIRMTQKAADTVLEHSPSNDQLDQAFDGQDPTKY